jgi:PAS domain S-box-containing protein
MDEHSLNPAALARENEELRHQLLEAEELIHAIRTGAVDALAVQGPEGPRIFTLQGADQGYRTLIEQMNEGAVLLNQDGTIMYCNACLAGWLRLNLAELIGGLFTDFVPPDFQSYWAGLVAKGWAGKVKGELPLLTSNGLLLPFSVSMNVLAFNDIPTLAVIVTDRSAQREVEMIQALVVEQNALIDRKNQELREQEAVRQAVERAAAETRRMLEGIPQIAWTANPQGVTTYLNHRWYAFTGPDNKLPLEQQWQAYLCPDDLAAMAERWAHALQTGETFEIEYRFRNQYGNYRWMLGRGLPSRNAAGDIIQWIGTCTDIHEHKLALGRIDQAQQELQENNEQLTRANVDLDNFIYTASHDLRAPITNIEGLLQALQAELPAGGGDGQQVSFIMGLMQDSVERFKKTIEHLTEVIKLQKENDQPKAMVGLAEVVQAVSLDLAPLLDETGATVEVDVAAFPMVSFAEKNLRSIIYNLLSNALKYRAPDRVPRVRISCRAEGRYAVLAVADNGLGLKPDYRGKLFIMFQRLHDHVEGSGIGLYMVKKIVENSGGRIEVSSQEGVGSTFSVYLRQ